jgi:hypothetical protein
MSVHLVPVGHQEYDIPDEFGSFHWQQDTSCSASRKTSYLDDRGQSDCVEIKAASLENRPREGARDLTGLGISKIETKCYEGKIKAGNLLISVHTENSAEIKRAKEMFTQAGAQDIRTTGETSTPKASHAADRAAHPLATAPAGHRALSS